MSNDLQTEISTAIKEQDNTKAYALLNRLTLELIDNSKYSPLKGKVDSHREGNALGQAFWENVDSKTKTAITIAGQRKAIKNVSYAIPLESILPITRIERIKKEIIQIIAVYTKDTTPKNIKNIGTLINMARNVTLDEKIRAQVSNIQPDPTPTNGITPDIYLSNSNIKHEVHYPEASKGKRRETGQTIDRIPESQNYTQLLETTHRAIGLTSTGLKNKQEDRMTRIETHFVDQFTKHLETSDSLAALTTYHQDAKTMLGNAAMQGQLDRILSAIDTAYAARVTKLANEVIASAQDNKETIIAIQERSIAAIQQLPDNAKNQGENRIKTAADERIRRLPAPTSMAKQPKKGIFSRFIAFIRKKLGIESKTSGNSTKPELKLLNKPESATQFQSKHTTNKVVPVNPKETSPQVNNTNRRSMGP
jgi:hypothetical protein